MFVLAFKPDMSLLTEGDAVVLTNVYGRSIRWRAPTPAWRRVLSVLAEKGASLPELEAIHGETGGESLASFHLRIIRLDERGVLTRTLTIARPCPSSGGAGGTDEKSASPTSIVRFIPTRPGAFRQLKVDPAACYRVSRFTTVRPGDGNWQVVHPLGAARLVVLEPRAMLLLAQLAAPTAIKDLCATLSDFTAPEVGAVVELLALAGAVAACDPSGDLEEDRDEALVQWEPTDLMLHANSRTSIGRHDYGASYRFRGLIEPLPAVKSVSEADSIALPVPDMKARCLQDPPFAAVVSSRRSTRDFTGRRLTLAHLSEFLYRTARVEAPLESKAGVPLAYTASRRPYPGAGACYPLELYLVVADCEGLAPGLYHYDPLRHRLSVVCGSTEDCKQLLDGAGVASGAKAPPPLLIVLAARFQRVLWKYQSMAYAAILKDVGVLYHQMYLNATALGMVGCALGGGDSGLFARAAGTCAHRESSVGEFMLGGVLANEIPAAPASGEGG